MNEAHAAARRWLREWAPEVAAARVECADLSTAELALEALALLTATRCTEHTTADVAGSLLLLLGVLCVREQDAAAERA